MHVKGNLRIARTLDRCPWIFKRWLIAVLVEEEASVKRSKANAVAFLDGCFRFLFVKHVECIRTESPAVGGDVYRTAAFTLDQIQCRISNDQRFACFDKERYERSGFVDRARDDDRTCQVFGKGGVAFVISAATLVLGEKACSDDVATFRRNTCVIAVCVAEFECRVERDCRFGSFGIPAEGICPKRFGNGTTEDDRDAGAAVCGA